MNTSTRRKPMEFYHAGGLVPAYELAKRYAGEGGRLATLPDIIEARLRTKFPALVWSKYFLTMTAEYFGVGRDGVRKLIVAHGVGPMATLEGIKKAYSWEYKDKDRNRSGGRISQEEFWKLEAGEYGEVSIIDFDTYFGFPDEINWRDYPMGAKRYTNALNDALLAARLGPKAEKFLRRSYTDSREWRRKENIDTCEGEDYTDPYVISHSGMTYPTLPISMDRFTQQSPKMAMAYLLTSEQQMTPYYESGPHLWTGINTHDWSDGTRFLAIPQGIEQFDTVLAGPDPREILDLHWDKLMRPVKEPAPEIGMRPLIEFGDEWFTEYPKVGARMDNKDPEFRVLSRKRMGKPVQFRTSAGGGIFFKYDLKEIAQIAPRGANAYRFTSSPEHYQEDLVVMIQFYRVKVDTSKRLIKSDELGQDYDTLLKLMDAPV